MMKMDDILYVTERRIGGEGMEIMEGGKNKGKGKEGKGGVTGERQELYREGRREGYQPPTKILHMGV